MAGTISSLIRGILAKSALFASKQRLLFECAALFEGVNIVRIYTIELADHTKAGYAALFRIVLPIIWEWFHNHNRFFSL